MTAIARYAIPPQTTGGCAKPWGRCIWWNAREEINHPIMAEIKARGIDLDQGMVVKFQDTCYHGADALNVMALLGTSSGWLNRMNATLFRSKTLSTFCYPAMRVARNLALLIKGVPENTQSGGVIDTGQLHFSVCFR